MNGSNAYVSRTIWQNVNGIRARYETACCRFPRTGAGNVFFSKASTNTENLEYLEYFERSRNERTRERPFYGRIGFTIVRHAACFTQNFSIDPGEIKGKNVRVESATIFVLFDKLKRTKEFVIFASIYVIIFFHGRKIIRFRI